MNDNIYEYRDEENWFIGKWEFSHSINDLGTKEEPNLCYLNQQLNRLLINNHACDNNDSGSEKGYHVTVVKKSSDFQLIRFIVDIINHEMNRHFEVRRFAGSVIVTEDERLHLVYLPTNGIDCSTFFGQSHRLFLDDTILIATHNEGKTKEFRKLFSKFGMAVENLNDHPELPEVKETGTTFEENARLKAETISKITQKMVLADDSGLKVDALGGLPGVWSARFSGPDATDKSNNAKLLHELAMVFDIKDRSAQFHTTLVVAAPNKESLVVEAEWDGYIAMKAKGSNGFGYDPLFIVGETGRHAAELTAEEKNKVSHRGLAVKKLMEVFPTWQAKQSL